MKALHYFFLISLQSISIYGLSQKPKLRFEHIATNKGLTQSNVISILQDARGFMWFGTNNGLNKYDGYKFTVYKTNTKNASSIQGNFIMDMANSRNGGIWIASLGGGVAYYDHRKEQFINFRADPGNKNSIVADDVTAILEDSDGKLWIGTNMGLDVYDPVTRLFTHYLQSTRGANTISDNYVRDLLEDSEGNIWIATSNGLNLFDRRTKKFTHYFHDANNPNTPASNHIMVLYEDSRKMLWVGTNDDGLDMFDKSKGIFEHHRSIPGDESSLINNAVRSIQEDDRKRIWIGTENFGISIFDPVVKRFYHYVHDDVDHSTLASNSVNTIYRDSKNNMWVGTFNAGIDLANPDASKFAHYKRMLSENSISNNYVLCFYEDSQKNIWIGTDGGGLNLFNPSTGRFDHFRHDKKNKNSPCGDNVLCVMEDSRNNIWIGTWGEGVSIFNRKNNTWSHLRHDPANPNSLSNDNAWTIMEDRNKNIWIGTYGGGVDRYDPVKKTFTHFQHKNESDGGLWDNWVSALFEDDEGNIWISTAGAGINILDIKTGKFSYINATSGLNSNNAGNITEDRNKNLWICTTTGLHYLDRKTNKYTIFTVEDGLPSNVVLGVLEDASGRMWISTAQGIARYDPADRKFRIYTVADGLQSNEFKEKAFLKASDGSMYFGGNNGFNHFFPDDIQNAPFDPPLLITNFQVFNKDVPIETGKDHPSPLKQSITETRSITIPYKYSVFSFEFASLNYTPAEQKHYAYMLEGFDNTWNEVGAQRMATYTNLDPGRYVFRVKGLNNNGEWSRNEARIELIITPPFWLTWWFRIAVILLVAGSVVLVYRLRVNNIKKQKRELELQVKQQTRQLVQANKEMELKNKELEQFAYIASHDLQEPLRTTTSFINLLQKQYAGVLDDKAGKYFIYITEAAKRMDTLIKDLLDYSRIGRKSERQQVDCNEVLAEVIADLHSAICDSNAVITCGPLPVINGYHTEMKQLFQNLVINAIKFRKKDTTPRINISARKTGHHWEFQIADNGIGIEKQHTEKIFVIFQRLHNRNEYPGSGIGLSHCKKIVELHKGEIWVNSIPGTGSTFHFTVQDN